MSEVVPIEQKRRQVQARPGGGNGSRPSDCFDRKELNQILQVYSRRVMSGEWLDYALRWDESGAVFAIYGATFGAPLYSIAKRSRPSRKSGRYQLVSRGRMLKSGQTLNEVLAVLSRGKLELVK